MTLSTITAILLLISVATNLALEGIKKLVKSSEKERPYNILAVLLSAVITVFTGVAYVILNDVPVTGDLIVTGIVMIFLSFLVATVGYDKVVQTISQLKKGE